MRPATLSLLVLSLLAAPLAAQAPATACKDGSSSATSGRGACSGHGGVDRKAMKAAEKSVKAEQKAAMQQAKTTGTMVTCTDGASSNPGRGACARHGGIRVAGATPMPTPRSTPKSMPTPTQTPTQTPTPSAAPSLPAAVPPSSPARTRSRAQSQAPSTTAPSSPSSRRGEDADPTGAIAQCKDGMYSHATHHQGACSRHHGVAKWMQ